MVSEAKFVAWFGELAGETDFESVEWPGGSSAAEEIPEKVEEEEEAGVVGLEPTLIQPVEEIKTEPQAVAPAPEVQEEAPEEAQEEARAPAVPAPLGPEDHAHFVFKRLDRDGNGKLDGDELLAAGEWLRESPIITI